MTFCSSYYITSKYSKSPRIRNSTFVIRPTQFLICTTISYRKWDNNLLITACSFLFMETNCTEKILFESVISQKSSHQQAWFSFSLYFLSIHYNLEPIMRESMRTYALDFYCSFKNCFIIHKNPNQYNEENICLNSGMHYWTGLEV